jgi:predicted nuclease with RNAse H fold
VKGRWCEQELARLGMPCYFTTKKSIIKNMVYRAIGLRARLERAGLKVIEVYPYASKVRLFGKPVPRKVTLQGLGWLRDKMAMLLPKSSAFLDIWDHNMCDAAVAAYTAFLYYQGLTEKVGRPEDGFIYIPAVSR